MPESDMHYYDWCGTGYIILNPDTCEAAYMISGNLCGGQSSENISMTAFTVIVAVAAVCGLAVYSYFAWSAFAAMASVIMSTGETMSMAMFKKD